MGRRKTKGTWGGWRPGAGAPKRPDSGTPHLARPLGRDRYALLTFTAHEDLPSLANPRLRRELEQSFEAAALPPGFQLRAWDTGRRQAWLLVEVASRRALGRGTRSLGARFARAVNRVFERTGRATADRYEMETFGDERAARRALAALRDRG